MDARLTDLVEVTTANETDLFLIVNPTTGASNKITKVNLGGGATTLKGLDYEVLVLTGTPEENGIKWRAAYEAITVFPYSLKTFGGIIDYLPLLNKENVRIGSIDKTNPLVVIQESDYSDYNMNLVSIINVVIPQFKSANNNSCTFENFTGDVSADNSNDSCIFKNVTGNVSANGNNVSCVFKNVTGNVSANGNNNSCTFENFTGDVSAKNDANSSCIFKNFTGNVLAGSENNYCVFENSKISVLTPVLTGGLVYNCQLPNDASSSTAKYRNCIDLSYNVIINN